MTKRELISGLPKLEAGHVWLVGAGPGDPGLLTMLAVHAIQQADIIVYDALVNDAILDLSRHGTEKYFAGKRGGKPSPKQRDISLRLVELAKAGKRVCRLKGGDPFVFGRGGEEALALVENQIPFRIVPGITAGIGGLAYAGIPATHRGINQSITFMTGHDASGLVPDAVNWQGISDGSPVIVMYMAMKHWANIRSRLMECGRKPDEMVAFICEATTDRQHVLETTLEASLADLKEANLGPPAIIVIGEAVRMRAAMDWLGALDGKTLHAGTGDYPANRIAG